MQLIRDDFTQAIPFKESVITIGNFDGLHLGHQSLIKKLKHLSLQYDLPTVLITFEPHPLEFFKRRLHGRLMRWSDKLAELQHYGIDYCVCLRFNEHLAHMPAEEYVKQILLQRYGMRAIVVGDDFRFGAKRLGDYRLLADLSRTCNFVTQEIDELQVGGERDSSTRVRETLLQGDMQSVTELLGHEYYISGRVAHGAQLGRQLGYPTANIYLPHKFLPMCGIYVSEVVGLASQPLSSITSLGYRPTFHSDKKLVLETYIFDFDDDLYGKKIQVKLLHKLRNEEKFATQDALIEQMAEDCKAARQWLVARHTI